MFCAGRGCWYQGGAQTNATWAPYCSAANCTCDAIDKQSLGVESHAMCWDHGGGGNSSQPSNSSSPDYDHWMQSLACLMVIPKKTTLRSVLIF